MYRLILVGFVLVAVNPRIAAAGSFPGRWIGSNAKDGPQDQDAQINNEYHSDTDISPYVVFAQATWSMLWPPDPDDEDDASKDLWNTIKGANGDIYHRKQNFFSSHAADPGQVDMPMAKLYVGPKNQCVVSFRPSGAGGKDETAAGVGELASSVGYPYWGIVRRFWPQNFNYDTATDTYYYVIIEEIGDSIDSWAHYEGCESLSAVGYSMGGGLAQIYAFRSWIGRGSFEVGAVYAFNPGPAGNPLWRSNYNGFVKRNGYIHEGYCRVSDSVKNLSAFGYTGSYGAVSDVRNWEMGCTSTGAPVSGVYDKDGPPADHDLRAWRTCKNDQGIHNRNAQCPLPNTDEKSDWVGKDPVYQREGAYLGNFVFVTQGIQPDGYQCVQIHGAKTDSVWDDNYFCSWGEIIMRWSTEGPIAGMECTHVTEPYDPTWGTKNYLCVQSGSSYRFTWLGEPTDWVDRARCVQWYENTNAYWWGSSNYMCWNTDNDSLAFNSPPPFTDVTPVTPIEPGGDQCDTTDQCRDRHGPHATDCQNSESSSSVCWCGTRRCDAGGGNDAGDDGGGDEGSSGDQCNTTDQCRDRYGPQATDCENSESSSSVCKCGTRRCDAGGGDGGGDDSGDEGSSGDQCNTTDQCRDRYGPQATDCENSESSWSVCRCGTHRCDAAR